MVHASPNAQAELMSATVFARLATLLALHAQIRLPKLAPVAAKDIC